MRLMQRGKRRQRIEAVDDLGVEPDRAGQGQCNRVDHTVADPNNIESALV